MRDPRRSGGLGGTPGDDSANSPSSGPNLLIRRSPSGIRECPSPSTHPGTGAFHVDRPLAWLVSSATPHSLTTAVRSTSTNPSVTARRTPSSPTVRALLVTFGIESTCPGGKCDPIATTRSADEPGAHHTCDVDAKQSTGRKGRDEGGWQERRDHERIVRRARRHWDVEPGLTILHMSGQVNRRPAGPDSTTAITARPSDSISTIVAT